MKWKVRVREGWLLRDKRNEKWLDEEFSRQVWLTWSPSSRFHVLWVVRVTNFWLWGGSLMISNHWFVISDVIANDFPTGGVGLSEKHMKAEQVICYESYATCLQYNLLHLVFKHSTSAKNRKHFQSILTIIFHLESWRTWLDFGSRRSKVMAMVNIICMWRLQGNSSNLSQYQSSLWPYKDFFGHNSQIHTLILTNCNWIA